MSGVTRTTPTSVRLSIDARYGSKLARTGLISKPQPNQAQSTADTPTRRHHGGSLRPLSMRGRGYETWSRPSGPSSIVYPRSASGPYPGGCSACRASPVTGGWSGASISLLPWSSLNGG
jgi:hypothetical protein